MNRKILVVLAVLVIALGWFFMQHRTTKDKKPVPEEMAQKLGQKILAFDLVNYAEDGSKKWQLKGGSADILAEIVNLTNIYIETYDTPEVTLTAFKGTYDRGNKVITLFDDVEVITSDGAVLITNRLKWDSKNDTITTDEPVRILRNDLIASGKGARALPQMKRIIINKDVKVRIIRRILKDIDIGKDDRKDGRESPVKAIITCKGPLEIDYEKNIALFKNDVLVDDKERQIYSDRMEAFLHPETKNIKRVVADGNVRVVRGADSTYSQRAIYTTEDQKIILVGKPEIYIKSTEEIEKIEGELEGM
ncbi:MAG: LPS export ABC transporter periplasmic protein LptC [Candidatus Omnitrophica bacterium]|nr:LPS export ABC transporter periplasmic protein LptC [Candidatus Omnitrophota bacterium]